MLKWCISVAAFLVVGLLATAATQAEQPPAKPQGFNERLTALLRDESASSEETFDKVRKILNDKPDTMIWPSTLWRMYERQMYPEAEARATAALLAQPQEIRFVEGYQAVRARCLLKLGRHAEALAAARGYYNVCSMQDTAKAIELLSEALAAAKGREDPTIVRRFKQQQLAGADPEAARQVAADPSATTKPAQDSILMSIALEPAPYAECIKLLSKSSSYDALTLRGYYLLLGGQTTEARQVLELALDIAPTKHLPAATENVAKAIRAQAGTVGPANAYIVARQGGK